EENLIRLARMLIEVGAEVDRQDLTGWSALHAAAGNGFRDAAELLLDSGANRRLRDINGLSPVDLAMDNAHDDLVDLFVSHG
ncbi:MAG: ankyrin repeat domain-containing protein, partial [Xanthomonadales bacterium]|nr:ankyrin repeat domain-containing protein [Xanthomonadales bacterium]